MFAQYSKRSLSSIKWFFWFSILLVLILLFELLQMGWRFYIGRNLSRNAVLFSREDPKATVHILVVGDSTAVGVGANPKSSIAGRLGEDFPEAEIVNLGKTGVRVKDVEEQLETVKGKKYDFILLQVGGNDILRFTPLEQLQENTASALKQAKELGDMVILITTGNVGNAPFFPWPIGWIYTERARSAREIFMQTAKDNGVIYADLFTERKDDPFLKDPKKFHAPDMLHPSGEGYGIWYEKLREILDKNTLQIKTLK